MNVDIFGARSSPTTCLYILNRTAEDNKEEYEDVADLVTSFFYVDNYLNLVNCESLAIERCQRLTRLLALGGFRFTEWLSSSRTVLPSMESKERMVPKIDLYLDDLPLEKTLGVQWDNERDQIVFILRPIKDVHTKREIRSEVASFFDQLGFLAPSF